MDLIGEFFIEFMFRRIIVGFFGYYALRAFYRLTSNENRLKWLDKESKHEGEEFGKGCLISIVGLISFTLFFILTGYIIMLIKNYSNI